MSDSANDEGAPIRPGEPLDTVLCGLRVPPLPDDFATRVLARSAGRPLPQAQELPPLRRAPGSFVSWRNGRRLAIGVLAVGAVASAAAASLLGAIPDRVPSPGEVWASIAGRSSAAEPASIPRSTPSAAAPSAAPAPAPGPASVAPVVVEGPIDSPEELEEVFRRLDDARVRRAERRREVVNQRIDRAFEQRREQGLPVPSPEREMRLRERIDQAHTRREQRIGKRIEARREELRGAIDTGEIIKRKDFLRGRGATPMIDRLRQLPPEERREKIRQWRERREQRLESATGSASESARS